MNDYEGKEKREAGAGRMLRVAREKAGRSLGEISAELHINETHLRSIENEQFSGIASPTFVKGYIRAYAKALDIDPDPVMREYLKVCEPAPQWNATPAIDEPVKDRNKQTIIYIAAGVAALLGIILVVWLFTRMIGSAETPVSETEILEKAEIQEPDITPSGSEAVDEPPAQSSRAEEMQAPAVEVEPVSGIDKSRAEAADTEGLSQEPAAAGLNQEQPVTAVETTVLEKAQTESRKTDKPAPTAEDQVEKPSETAAVKAGSDTLKLTFAGDSWLEVRNSAGQKLALGIEKAGSVREFTGSAPFQVFLGNAPNVQVEFNGRPFDSTRFQRKNNTARFTLKNP
ncbi:MAG: RodZ domain-containing protein [Thiotrichales bacterium]